MTVGPVEQRDPFRHADKHRSWDEFGAQYWAGAATTSHPSDFERGVFLTGSRRSTRVLVLGATTTEVIRAALETGAEVHVLDFAAALLALASEQFGPALQCHEHDLLCDPPEHLRAHFDLVVADRLVNRFHRSEMPRVVANMMALVAPEGALRVSVRFGLYPLDRQLIDIGTQRGTLTAFWDDATQTIDWSGVGNELDACAEDHGSIPREVVIAWSRMRGVESRLQPEDVATIVAQSSPESDPFLIRRVTEMDVAPQSKIYEIVRRSGSRGA